MSMPRTYASLDSRRLLCCVWSSIISALCARRTLASSASSSRRCDCSTSCCLCSSVCLAWSSLCCTSACCLRASNRRMRSSCTCFPRSNSAVTCCRACSRSAASAHFVASDCRMPASSSRAPCVRPRTVLAPAAASPSLPSSLSRASSRPVSWASTCWRCARARFSSPFSSSLAFCCRAASCSSRTSSSRPSGLSAICPCRSATPPLTSARRCWQPAARPLVSASLPSASWQTRSASFPCFLSFSMVILISCTSFSAAHSAFSSWLCLSLAATSSCSLWFDLSTSSRRATSREWTDSFSSVMTMNCASL
mmetsp:Transcript_98537/g.279240  ORF Transcript_98537/g.279240 Transcript_98537/m.279240 type:complete len:309 (-) Transcript_98537:454-1380(-)